MALYEIQHLTFTYPLLDTATLKDINLSIEKGDFVLLFGPSGSGKSTLLRHLKEEVRPVGTCEGQILFNGALLSSLSPTDSSSKIGMVFQNPDQQIILSTVYEELAFGMENLGFDPKEMQRRIGEMSTFLGINHWLHKATHELSGGQKQLLNLASVMTLYPEVLLLDEPTSQLDPISKQNFLNILKRLNEEFSITIVMTEHDLEAVFPLVDQVHLLEKGHLTYTGSPRQSLLTLYEKKASHLLEYLPSISRLYLNFTSHPVVDAIPLIPKEARLWFEQLPLNDLPKSVGSTGSVASAEPHPHRASSKPFSKISKEDILLQCEDLYFQYTKSGPLILERIHLGVPKGCFLAILGGNGSGKSTFLKVLAGILSPLKGKIKTSATIGYLPQNPMTLFHETTVDLQLRNTFNAPLTSEQKDQVEALIDFLDLRSILTQHPYDLSGGQMQKVALATVLLTKPTLLLLDEPTKGLDPYFKKQLASYLHTLIDQGTTIVMVSHDLEFVAAHSTLATLMFSGQLLALAPTHTFFSDNVFYTTIIHRTVKGRLPHAITLQEVNQLVKN